MVGSFIAAIVRSVTSHSVARKHEKHEIFLYIVGISFVSFCIFLHSLDVRCGIINTNVGMRGQRI